MAKNGNNFEDENKRYNSRELDSPKTDEFSIDDIISEFKSEQTEKETAAETTGEDAELEVKPFVPYNPYPEESAVNEADLSFAEPSEDSLFDDDELEEQQTIPRRKRGFFSRREKGDKKKSSAREYPDEDYETSSFKITEEFTKAFEDNPEFDKHFAPSETFIGNLDLHDLPEDEVEGVPEQKPKKKRAEAPHPVDIPVGTMAKQLTPYVKLLRARCYIVAVLCIPLCYLSIAHKFLWPLPEFIKYQNNPYIYLGVLLTLEILVMLCAVDVVATGTFDIFRLRLGAESLAVMSCVASILHVLTIIMFPSWGGYLPYCAISALSLFAVMWGTYLRLSALRISCQVAHSVRSPYAVVRGEFTEKKEPGFLKCQAGTAGFVEQSEAPDIVRRFSSFFAPLAIVASFVLAIVSSIGVGEPGRFFWSFSAILAPAATLPAIFGFTLPFINAAKRLQSTGAALAGWTGARLMSQGKMAVVRDLDLFPPDAVVLNGFKMLGDFSPDKVITYAASLIRASGSGMTAVFNELLRDQPTAFRNVSNFQHHEGGGIGGEVEGATVLLGSANFMIRMGIKVSQKVNLKSAVYVAIHSEVVGVFAVNYVASSSVPQSLTALHGHGVMPLLATRDFNITPAMVTSKFKLPASAVEFPEIEERLALSDPNYQISSKPVAIVVREGLLPYAESIIIGRRVVKVTRINMVINAIAASLGMLIMFFLAFSGSYASASPAHLFMFMLMWAIPALLISGWVSRY